MKTKIKKSFTLRTALLAAVCGTAWSAGAAVFTSDTTIAPNNSAYDGTDIVVSNATLTVDGPHTFASLLVGPGGVVTHSFSPSGTIPNVLTVLDEPQILTDTNEVTLTSATILAATVTVKDLSGTITYQTNADFLIRVDGAETFLSRSATSTIPDGAMVLVSYDWDGESIAAVLNLTLTGNFAVSPGGSVNANGRGYSGAFGQGKGNGNPTSNGSGGGHGGYGGLSSSNFAGGLCYGNFEAPSNLGSGGGPGVGGNGGSGGGRIRLSVGGAALIDGVICANGANATNNRSGGGSGGSIWITAPIIAGIGTISANGGNGEPIQGGGGGGGRIALHFGTDDFSGPLQAFGGSGWQRGGAGTIFRANTNQNTRSLLVHNGGITGASSLIQILSSPAVTIAGNAGIEVTSSQTMGNLLVRSNSWVQMPGPGSSAIMTINGTATIETGAEIRADGRGSAGGQGSGAGQTANIIQGGSFYVGTGGGHGGVGGASAYGGNGGVSYGSFTIPNLSGSGGGHSTPGGPSGGAGGGIIRMTVTGDLIVDGKLSANGLPGSQTRAGGGTGGSIFLSAATIAGQGTISANGGNGNNGGGNGAGGRIAITFATNSFTGSLAALGGTITNLGGAGTIYLRNTSASFGDLFVQSSGPTAALTSVDLTSTLNVYLSGGARFQPSSSTVNLGNFLVGSNSTFVIQSSGAITVQNNATVEFGGTITGDGLGSGSGSGSGSGVYNQSGSTGGGHGGYGGRGAGTSTSTFPGGNVYGSAASPTIAGSVGGGPTTGTGGPGGSALRLIVNGALQLDGLISVNGLATTNTGCGGGSGGSAWLTLNEFAGTGRIAAEGGGGHLPTGGGGGGGRIAIYWTSNNFLGTYSAKGGPGWAAGGAGTIYLRRTGSAMPSLVFDNAGQIGTSSALDLTSLEDLYLGTGVTISNLNTSLTVSNLILTTNATLRGASTTLTLTVANAANIGPGSAILLEGVSTSGSGTGSGNSPGYSGGGHGGYGGRGSGTSSFNGGNVYSTSVNPAQAGSPGGGGSGLGNQGGGALRLTVGGPLHLDGRISVNAGATATNNAGGGSGGSLWLTLNQFSGNGSLMANGGNGHLPGGGGGGGGRIAMYYYTNTFAGSIQAQGGLGFANGGAGTILLQNRNNQTPSFRADNGGLSGTNTPLDSSPPQYDNLIITGGARLTVPNSILRVNTFSIETNSSLFGNVTIDLTSNGVVAAGGSIIADGTGTSTIGTGGSHFSGAGGGGHGGYGGRGAGANGGNAYDSLIHPTQAGSSGSSSSFGGGGSGGGLIQISSTVSSFSPSKLILNGKISANGNSTSTNASGGGSGGTVSISVRDFAGSGEISANGGSGGGTGGGGGGGRIAVTCTTNLFTGTYSGKGGTGWMAGGAGTIYVKTNSPISNFAAVLLDNGGVRGTNTPITLTGGVGTLDITVQGGASATNLHLVTTRSLLVRSNGWIAQSGSFTVSGDVTIDAGGGFDLDGFATSGLGTGSTSTSNKGGGGHGGIGGNNSLTSGQAYDSITSPTLNGSPGGNGSGSTFAPFGGAGGGATRLTVGNTLTLNGVIRANGRDGEADSGGGSGGSIWIQTKTLAGQGRISAIGGAGNNAAGGGGGGRIAVYYDTNLFTGDAIAFGGAGSIAGGAGTIYFKRNNSATGELRIAHAGLPGATTPLSSAYAWPPAPFSLIITSNATVQPLTPLPTLSQFFLGSGCSLLPATNATGLSLNVLGNATVSDTALIGVNGRGYQSNQGVSPGAVLSDTGGGGGHGGPGGNSALGALGGGTNDWPAQPTLPGSGGGVGPYQFGNTSAGGGVIRLNVGGTLTLDGELNANGQPGWTDDSGGGAGGSIWITASTLSEAGNIFATGGDGDFFFGGGGGGGRIAIYSPTNLFSGLMNVTGGDGANTGGLGTIFFSTNLFPIEAISGRVTNLLGQPIAGVLIQATAGVTNTLTDLDGLYSLIVTGGWTGTLTPVLGTNLFVPSIRSYVDFGPSLTDQNFLMVDSVTPTLAWQRSGTNLSLSWHGIPGVTYQVETSTNLVNWEALPSGWIGNNATLATFIPVADEPQIFLRLRATH